MKDSVKLDKNQVSLSALIDELNQYCVLSVFGHNGGMLQATNKNVFFWVTLYETKTENFYVKHLW